MYYSHLDAQREIRRRLSEGQVIITEHAAKKMRERNITRQDVTQCLRNGVVLRSEKDSEHSCWKYRVQFDISSQETVTLIVALPDNSDEDIVITTF